MWSDSRFRRAAGRSLAERHPVGRVELSLHYVGWDQDLPEARRLVAPTVRAQRERKSRPALALVDLAARAQLGRHPLPRRAVVAPLPVAAAA
eukprot:1826204-Prymnesium_polylepis.2